MRGVQVVLAAGLLLLLNSLGCGLRDPGRGKLDGLWGPGVQDVEAARQKMLSLIRETNADDCEDWDRTEAEVAGIFYTMSWDQATYAYRTSGTDLRRVLVHLLVGQSGGRGHFPAGMSKEDIINLLGKPDGDWGECLVYTGADSASDSTSGYLFFLDENQRLTHVGCGP